MSFSTLLQHSPSTSSSHSKWPFAKQVQNISTQIHRRGLSFFQSCSENPSKPLGKQSLLRGQHRHRWNPTSDFGSRFRIGICDRKNRLCFRIQFQAHLSDSRISMHDFVSFRFARFGHFNWCWTSQFLIIN